MSELREKIEEKAQEIESWIQNAVGDMAFDHTFLDEEWQVKIRKAKKRGVTDIQGWLADEFYNDVDTLRDLMGDQIHDAATQLVSFENPKHGETMIRICEEIKGGHTAMNEAMDMIIKSQKTFLEKHYYEKKL